jgi:hypothetical protein
MDKANFHADEKAREFSSHITAFISEAYCIPLEVVHTLTHLKLTFCIKRVKYCKFSLFSKLRLK